MLTKIEILNEIQKNVELEKFICPVIIQDELPENVKKYYLETPSFDLPIGDEMRLALGVAACPEMDEILKVDRDKVYFFINSFIRLQKNLNLSDEKLRKIIKMYIKHEKRHIDQFNWLRLHHVPKERWYYDDATRYGWGNMELDANLASYDFYYDLDTFMSKYLETFSGVVFGTCKGLVKTIFKFNKASAVIVAQLAIAASISYCVKKKFSN